MTSNLGANILLEGNNSPAARAAVMHAVRAHFRPEFLNRIDEIVQFDPLSPPQLREVARLQTVELNQRLKDRGIGLTCTDAALDYAVAESYDHMYGARPLRRWLEHSIVTPLSRMIIAGELPDDSRVVVDVRPGAGLVFNVAPDEEAARSRASARANGLKKIKLASGAMDEEDEYDLMEDE